MLLAEDLKMDRIANPPAQSPGRVKPANANNDSRSVFNFARGRTFCPPFFFVTQAVSLRRKFTVCVTLDRTHPRPRQFPSHAVQFTPYELDHANRKLPTDALHRVACSHLNNDCSAPENISSRQL